jgi:hypothetical protein
MNALLFLFLILIGNSLGEVPNFNFATSAMDLLKDRDTYKYTIDNRNGWYDSSDLLEKTITKSGSTITHKNHFVMYKGDWDYNNRKIDTDQNVNFESVESFYLNIDGQADTPLVCPRGNFFPIKVWWQHGQYEIKYDNEKWTGNDKKDLKCFYHRAGAFLIFHMNNGENYVLEMTTGQNVFETKKYKLNDDIKELYDFKLMNRDTKYDWTHWDDEYPFMALVKKDDYLQLVTAKYDFRSDKTQQYIFDNNKKLLPIKAHTQGYFNNFHYNNSFFYFTYNNIHDFTSGYSSQAIGTDKHQDYSNNDDVVIKNNNISPFEFVDDVEIEQMEIMYNNNLVYYKIRNKVTNKYYHGILDIRTNKIVWNTDKIVKVFIPYIQTRVTSNQGRY